MITGRTVVVAALLSWGSTACSVAFDLDREQCTEDADCVALGLANGSCEAGVCVGSSLPPQWACLDGFQEPEPPGDMVEHRMRFEYAAEPDTRPAGIAIELCNSLDQSCENPITTPQPEADGSVTITVSKNFTGYLQVTATDVVDSLVYLQTPIVFPMQPNIIKLIRQSEINALAVAEGLEIDPMRGQIVILTHNCNDERQAGVVISTQNALPDGTLDFYFQGALPDPDGLETDDQGAAGYFNAPAQGLTIESFLADSGRRIGKTGVTVRPGGITYGVVGPTVD